MISIGLVSGPVSSVFEEQCRIVLTLFESKRNAVESEALVNVVFHSPLCLKKADHEGMAVGAFSKPKKKILVAIAVPMNVTTFENHTVVDYIHKTLHDAADVGIDHLERNKIGVKRESFHEFIDQTMNCLQGPPPPSSPP